MEKIKISVIVPVYNTEKYLEKCLNSLLNQTFKDIEIICVDDGSKDNSLNIIKSFSQKDSRFRVIEQKNLGVSAARNIGVKNSVGEYISFIDSDDWIDSNYYEKLYEAAKKHGADITCSSIVRKRTNSEKYRVCYAKEEICTTLEDKMKLCDIPRYCYVWNKLYKKEVIKNKLFKEGVYFEDILWTPEVLKSANKIVSVPNINYYYFVRKNSIVKSVQSKQKQKDLYDAQKYIIKFFEENNLFLEEKYRKINKRIYYLGIIPLIKIKEYYYKYF